MTDRADASAPAGEPPLPYEAAFDSAAVGLALIAGDGRLLRVNAALCQMLGRRAEELVGQWLTHDGSQGGVPPEYHEQPYPRADGSTGWLALKTRRVRGHQSYVVSVKDITRRKTLERTVWQPAAAMAGADAHGRAWRARFDYVVRHDALTGLENRHLLPMHLRRALYRARRHQRPGAVLVLDIDRLQTVNDSFGHAAGDELLVQTVQRLRGRLRDGDWLARFGGDEFVVLVEDLHEAADAARIARKLGAAMAQPFRLACGAEVYLGATIGLSLFGGRDSDGDTVLQQAAAALHLAKRESRGSFRFFSDELTATARQRLAIESRLHQALQEQRFELYYQPLVDLASGQVRGAEALVRWHDPVAGLVTPERFISIAEDTGLIVPLGEWALQRACSDLVEWQRQGLDIEHVAVNLAPRQLELPDLDRRVQRVLDDTGLAPSALELEITEGALGGDPALIKTRLRRLKALGLRIAVDDFGTGYSSLLHLKRFPVDQLKIDRGFVHDLPGDATSTGIVTTITALGRLLGLDVLAEGVETREQAELMRRLGCQFAQGYHFGRPVPAAEFVTLLHRAAVAA